MHENNIIMASFDMNRSACLNLHLFLNYIDAANPTEVFII